MSAAERARWDKRYRSGVPSREPSAWLVSLAERLPRAGNALDLAGGAGRHAVWLARRGLDVTLVDISPLGLGIARQGAREAGVTLTTVEADLDVEPGPLGPWGLIVSHHYLNRAILATLASRLTPGGLLAFNHPTESNLLRNDHPSARYLLRDGEIVSLLIGLEVISHHEGWTDEGRHEAHVLARRASSPSVG